LPKQGNAKGRLPSISALIPNLYLHLRPTFDGDSPIISAASIFLMNDVHIVPMVTSRPANSSPKLLGQKLQGAFGGFPLLRKIANTAPRDYYELLWTPSREFVVGIGDCKFDDSLDVLLRVFQETNFGYARVDNKGRSVLISLEDLVQLMRKGSLKSDMTASEAGSQVIHISPDASIKEAIDMMISHRVRRLFLDGKDSAFVSDRSIITYMFGGERIYFVRRNPEQWIDAKVTDTNLGAAPTVAATDSISDVAQVFGVQPDACLMTDDGKVVSRWDMVMKPWKAGALVSGAAVSNSESS